MWAHFILPIGHHLCMIVETVDTYIKLISLKPLNHKLCGAWHTHESSLDGVYNLLDMCCFLSWSCQTGCHTQLFSSPSKSCSLDLDSCSLCHIMYHRWWPHSHYSLQPHSLTPRWQSSNDMAVGWFDGITNSSLQQREDKKGVKKKVVKDSQSPCPLLYAPAVITI